VAIVEGSGREISSVSNEPTYVLSKVRAVDPVGGMLV